MGFWFASTGVERATLEALSWEGDEMVTGPGDTRAAVLGYPKRTLSSLSGAGSVGDDLGAGAPGTKLGIWPKEGKVLEKGEGAGFNGGGVGVDAGSTDDTEHTVRSWFGTLPFSLTKPAVLTWSCWEEVLSLEEPWPGKATGLQVLVTLPPTPPPASFPSTTPTSAGSTRVTIASASLLESFPFWLSDALSPAPLKRLRVMSSSPSDAVRRRRLPSPFPPSPSFLRLSWL